MLVMTKRAFLFGVLFVLGVNCDDGDHDDFLEDPSAFTAWSWHLPDLFGSESRAASDQRDVEEVTQKDREPLSPDFKDPDVNFSGETAKSNKKPTTSFDSAVLPSGVVDVDASGLSFSADDIPTFGFSSSFTSRPGTGLFGLGGFFGVAEPKPWWKGGNVCIEREETTDDDDENIESSRKSNSTDISDHVPNYFSTSVSFSNCQQTPTKYECTTKINNHGVVKIFVVRYKCCYGYKRDDESSGCHRKLILHPLLKTIENVGGNDFADLIRSTDSQDIFEKENLTIFMPTNSALNQFSDQIETINQVQAERRRRQVKNSVSSKDFVLNHAFSGFIELSELVNEEVINSYNTNNNAVRINIYPTRNNGKMVTANCVRVHKADNLATNGVVHVIDGVLNPIGESLVDILNEHPQLSNFRTALEGSDLLKNLKANGHYTIFAPTNEAFNKLEQSTKEKILRGDVCAATILKHHIAGYTVCSNAIIGNATTHNVQNELLNLQRSDDDVLLFENKAKIIKTDIVGTNGVIHLIDEVIIPDSALYISQALKNDNFTKFQDIIDQAGLTEELDSLKNLTLFAPSDKAFDNPETSKLLDEIKDDKDKLRELVLYHAVQGKYESCNMNNNILLKSKNHDKNIRLNLYSTLPVFTNIINRATVNCARLTGYDEKTCGSVVHEINKVLVPPSSSLLDMINSDENYSTFSQIVKGTDAEKVLQDNSESLTILIPTNEAFDKLEAGELKLLIDNKEAGNALVKNHVLTEILCCSGIGPQTWGFNSLVPTLSHQHQSYGRLGDDIHFGSASVLSCDNVATNGVIHKINKVLIPKQARRQGLEFFLLNL